MKKAQWKRIGSGVAIAAFWLILWTLLAQIVHKNLLLPYPWTVLRTLLDLFATLPFWESVFLTVVRIIVGFCSAAICGTVLAILTSRLQLAYRLFYPLITVIRATPVASFIILIWIWLGSGKLPVFICFLMVLPIIWAAVSDGIQSVDPKLKQVCDIYRSPIKKRVLNLYVPTILPYFLSSCKTSIGMAWKAGVAAEVLAVTQHSIGERLYSAKLYLETDEVFAWTAVVIILSLAIEKLASFAIEKIAKRRAYVEN